MMMRFGVGLLLGVGSWLLLAPHGYGQCAAQKEFTLILHTGSGKLEYKKKNRDLYQKILEPLLKEAHENLKKGHRALDVVEQVVMALEDSPHFNAGRGAITNNRGEYELDASIMDGKSLNAGSVAAIKDVKNPVAVARMVMDKTPHVMIVGQGAQDFALSQGVKLVEPSYFKGATYQPKELQEIYGTVGAAAWDRCGDLASATSTGGYITKIPGRVGDSPIIGAGTYADNATAALSATGHGEFFIRYAVTHSISMLMKHKGLSLKAAADQMIKGTLKEVQATGAVVGVDSKGAAHASYNTQGLLYGVTTQAEPFAIRYE